MTDTSGGGSDDGARPGLDPGTWRLAVVAGVKMDMPGEHPEVMVHEAVSPWRELAIPVSMGDGNAIAYAWRGLTTPKPLTHALFTEVLDRHGVTVEAVRITARRGRSYFAELDTTGPKGRQVIPCRPSDALALVLRQRMPTPVLVADWVFDDDEDEPDQVDVVAPADAAPVDPAQVDAAQVDAAQGDDVVPDPVGEPDLSVVVDNVADTGTTDTATTDSTDGA
jgi:uncharacterized protein